MDSVQPPRDIHRPRERGVHDDQHCLPLHRNFDVADAPEALARRWLDFHCGWRRHPGTSGVLLGLLSGAPGLPLRSPGNFRYVVGVDRYPRATDYRSPADRTRHSAAGQAS